MQLCHLIKPEVLGWGRLPGASQKSLEPVDLLRYLSASATVRGEVSWQIIVWEKSL